MERKQVVGTEPNSIKVTPPLEHNSPKSNSGGAPATETENAATQTGPVAGAPGSNADTKIMFNSATIGSRENARTKDYFAEQNQETLTKKQAHSTAVKRSLIVACGFVGVALLVGIGIWIIASLKQPAMPTSAEEYNELSESEKVERNRNMAQETYDAATKDSDNTGEVVDTEAVMGSFQTAIDSTSNVTDAHIARIAAMRYLIGEGDYTKVIELGEQINNGNGACEYSELDLDSLITCHNLLEIAYHQLGDEASSQKHAEVLLNLIDEKTGV